MTRPTPWNRPTPPGFDHEAWTRRNSSLTPAECTSVGVCGHCGGRHGLWWSTADEFGYTPCRHCQQT